MSDAPLPLRIGGVMRCCVATLDAIGPPASMTKEGDTLSCSYCSSGLIVRGGAWEWWKDKPTEGGQSSTAIREDSDGD